MAHTERLQYSNDSEFSQNVHHWVSEIEFWLSWVCHGCISTEPSMSTMPEDTTLPFTLGLCSGHEGNVMADSASYQPTMAHYDYLQ